MKLDAICERFGLSGISEAIDQSVIAYSHDLAKHDRLYAEILQGQIKPVLPQVDPGVQSVSLSPEQLQQVPKEDGGDD